MEEKKTNDTTWAAIEDATVRRALARRLTGRVGPFYRPTVMGFAAVQNTPVIDGRYSIIEPRTKKQ